MSDQHTPLEVELLETVAKLLSGMNSLPVKILNGQMVDAIEDACNLLLKHHG